MFISLWQQNRYLWHWRNSVESTEDPFSLGGIEIDVDTSQTEAETEPAIEVEVIETDADGSKTSLYSDGSIRHTSNIDSLPEVDKLTESESLTLQTIVANWDADAALSSDMLRDNINTDNLPSLSVAIVYETWYYTDNEPKYKH